MVVKNSLAARATEGTPLAPLFEGLGGTAAICWGGEDIVSLAKEITKLVRDDKYKPFEARGGVMDGERLTAAEVQRVSKWPSRSEQLSILLGQILSPGANAGQPIELGGRGAGQPDRAARRGREESERGRREDELQSEDRKLQIAKRRSRRRAKPEAEVRFAICNFQFA